MALWQITGPGPRPEPDEFWEVKLYDGAQFWFCSLCKKYEPDGGYGGHASSQAHQNRAAHWRWRKSQEQPPQLALPAPHPPPPPPPATGAPGLQPPSGNASSMPPSGGAGSGGAGSTAAATAAQQTAPMAVEEDVAMIKATVTQLLEKLEPMAESIESIKTTVNQLRDKVQSMAEDGSSSASATSEIDPAWAVPSLAPGMMQ